MKKVILSENSLPEVWYNVIPDLPFKMPPVLHPATRQPVTPEDLMPLFPMELILQEVSDQSEIMIPEKVKEIYSLWRPTPLVRATNLEKAIGTSSKIYFKNESVSPAGSHKPNTAVAQVYYNSEENVRTITTETGAGQWGSALSFACSLFGINCKVFMVKVSYEQKPYRKSMIRTWGAEIVPSPSEETVAGRRVLAEAPDSPGSLGIAISEAVEVAATNQDTKYSLGSVLNHVLLHQTVVGQEAREQFQLIEDYPDVVIGCVGGGSNFAGLAFPFLRDKINGREIEILAVEPASCPTLTKGIYAYDFGDTIGLTPLMAMFTLGHDFIPPKIHAGGLRYHGAAPLVSMLVKNNLVKPVAYEQLSVFEAAITFARTEGVIPAPESSHAIKAAIDEAKKADEEGLSKTILFNLSGHGHFDMSAYDDYLEGKLVKHEFFDNLPEVRETIFGDIPSVV